MKLQKYIIGADPELCAIILPFDENGRFGQWQGFGGGIIYKADEVDAELAALRDENERLRQQVRERPDQEAIDMALSRAVLAERELAALRRPVGQSREIEAIRKTYKLGPATHTEIERLLSALDLSAQECAGLRIDKQRMQVSLDAAYARLASHDACLAQVREEMPEVEALRKDTNNGIERGLNGQTTALIAISRLQHWEAAHRAALKEAAETIAGLTPNAVRHADEIAELESRLRDAEARGRQLEKDLELHFEHTGLIAVRHLEDANQRLKSAARADRARDLRAAERVQQLHADRRVPRKDVAPPRWTLRSRLPARA